MFAIIGILVVLGSIIGGYLMEHGSLKVLMQPAELVIIGGAAAGTVLIANPLHVLKALVAGTIGVFKGSPYTEKRYLETLQLLYELVAQARRNGISKLEEALEKPDQDPMFSKYPVFLKDHHACTFLMDTLRIAATGSSSPHELDALLETDLEIHHHESQQPVSALSTMADSLPGLGIVAAVLGVVITMGALGGPPEEIGHKVAAALVGTFLGILMCYGFFSPLAANISKINEAEAQYLGCLRAGLMAFLRGAGPLIATEFARRSIPGHIRPTFTTMEQACKQPAKAEAA
jgi:chemotaxis protein MotA